MRVGFVGLGRMGQPMATNLARAGLLAAVWNRTREPAEALASATGAARCATPADLAARVDVVITMVSDEEASASAYLGPDGIAAGAGPALVAVEMSTVGVDHVWRLADALPCEFLDAPVSGSVAAAADASLTLMVGGDAAAFARAEPALVALGSKIFHLGATGAGAAMKLAVNAAIFGLNEALAEGLVLAERAGIARGRAYDVFASSAAAAPFVHYRRDAFERPGEAPVAFRLALAAKDLRLILGLAERTHATMPQAERNLEVLARAVEAGLGDADVSAVAEFLRHGKEG